jgi:hypothetical protein
MTRMAGGGGSNGLRAQGGARPYGGLLSTTGDNVVVAGIAGKRLRLLWVAFIPKGDNTTDNLITISFEDATENLYVGYALAHWEPFVGAVGKGIVVNLENVQPVAVTLHYDVLNA